MPDFVISYVEPDRPWVEWVVWEIERGGGRVDLHRADRHGQVFAMVEDASSRVHVPLLSAAYQRKARPAAMWWLTSDDRKPARPDTMDHGVLPVAVGFLDPPAPVEGCLDLRPVDDAETAGDLLRGYLGLGPPPRDPSTIGRYFGSDRPAYPARLPPVWRIGPRPHGRSVDETVYRSLANTLARSPDGLTCVNLCGPTASGKTSLVREYAYRHAEGYAGCWWIEAATPQIVPIQIRRMLKTRQASHALGRWLLVLDDVTDPHGLPALPDGNLHVIATSTRPFPDHTAETLNLAEPTGKHDLLASIRASIERLEDAAPLAAALLRLLGALGPASVPLTLLSAGADGAPLDLAGPLRSRDRTDDLLIELCSAGLAWRTPDTVGVPAMVRRALRTDADGQALSASAGSARSARNVAMLGALGYSYRQVPPVDWLPLLSHLVACLTVPVVTTAPAADDHLLEYLLGWETGRLQPVPLSIALEQVSAVLHALGEPVLALEFAQRRAALTRHDHSESADIDAMIQHATMLRTAHRPTAALEESRRAETQATAPIESDGLTDRRSDFESPHLLVEKAQILADLGRIDEALKTMEHLEALRRAGAWPFPPDHGARLVHAKLLIIAGRFAQALDELAARPDALATEDDRAEGIRHTLLAQAHLGLEQPDSALAHAQSAISIWTAHDAGQGEDGHLALARLCRAAALCSQGQSSAALEETDIALAVAETFADQKALLDVLAFAGTILGDLHRLDRAIVVLQRARTLAATQNASPAFRASVDIRLAKSHLESGRADRAAAVLADTIALIDDDSRRLPAHTQITALNLFVRVEQECGRPDLALAERATTLTSADGKWEPNQRLAVYQLGTVLIDLQRPAEAVVVFQSALAALEESTEHTQETADSTLLFGLGLARASLEADRPEEAVAVADATPWDVDEDEHTHITMIGGLLLQRAMALYALGRRTDALHAMNESADLITTMAGAASPALIDLLEQVNEFLLRVGEFQAAVRHIMRTQYLASEVYGHRSLRYAGALDHLGRARIGLGCAQSAVIAIDGGPGPSITALEITREHFGERHQLVAVRLHNLGDALDAAGRSDEALPLLQEAVRIDTAIYGPQHPEVELDRQTLHRVMQHATEHRRQGDDFTTMNT